MGARNRGIAFSEVSSASMADELQTAIECCEENSGHAVRARSDSLGDGVWWLTAQLRTSKVRLGA
jgi:hypothetical protein